MYRSWGSGGARGVRAGDLRDGAPRRGRPGRGESASAPGGGARPSRGHGNSIRIRDTTVWAREASGRGPNTPGRARGRPGGVPGAPLGGRGAARRVPPSGTSNQVVPGRSRGRGTRHKPRASRATDSVPGPRGTGRPRRTPGSPFLLGPASCPPGSASGARGYSLRERRPDLKVVRSASGTVGGGRP